MYESRNATPLTRAEFRWRMVLHASSALVLLAVSLAVGMVGYVAFEGLPWIDAFLNSAMLLGGMGPVDAPRTPSGKLFAGLYALYAGLVFLVTVALVAAPLLHRLLHRFHWTDRA